MLVIQMHLFNVLLVPPLLYRVCSKEVVQQKSSVDIWCFFTVLEDGTHVTEISSRNCGDVGHKQGQNT